MSEITKIGGSQGWRYVVVRREKGFEVLRQTMGEDPIEESLLVADTLKAAIRKGIDAMISGTSGIRIKKQPADKWIA